MSPSLDISSLQSSTTPWELSLESLRAVRPEGQPQRAADVDVGVRVAAWFWTSRGLNALADVGDFREITRRINGRVNGSPSARLTRRALELLTH